MAIKLSMLAFSIVVCLANGVAHAQVLQGKIVNLQGTPVAGVEVSLNNSPRKAYSDSEGNWAFEAVTSVHSSPSHLKHDRVIMLDGKRVTIRVKGNKNILGQSMEGGSPEIEPRIDPAIRLALPSDTLLIKWNGKTLFRFAYDSIGKMPSILSIDTLWSDDYGIPWNPYVIYGSIPYDGGKRAYRTVSIGGRTWMAENLNFYQVDSANSSYPGMCSPYYSDSCWTEGRLYDWVEITKLGSYCYDAFCTMSRNSMQGICPTGWRLPDEADWDSLSAFIERDLRVGKGFSGSALKCKTASNLCGEASDAFGFRGLLLGFVNAFGNMNREGYWTRWWSTSDDEVSAPAATVGLASTAMTKYFEDKRSRVSVRCIKCSSYKYGICQR